MDHKWRDPMRKWNRWQDKYKLKNHHLEYINPFLLLLASVVTVADTAGAVEDILWRENGNGLCNYMGHV